MQASTSAVGAAEVATGPARLPPEHADNACSPQAPDSYKGAPSSDPWAPRVHYTVDVAPSKRTKCHGCGRAFNSGELRVAHVFTCTAYGNVCSKTRWFHVDHCDMPPDGWSRVQGYDLLEPTARRVLEGHTRSVSCSTTSSPTGPARRARRRKTADPPFNPKRTKTPVQRFANACRLAVHADIEAFRTAFFREHDSPRCPVTGEPLERVTSHVHHDGGLTAFHDLVRAFVREQHVNLPRIEYLAGRLLDDSLRGAFVAYHKEHARLMVVSGTANLSHLRKG